MTTRIKLRRDTAALWTTNNPILAAGEPGLETDTGKTKYGNGTTAWVDLSYATGGITARPAVGYFGFHGPVPNPGDADWWFEGVESDPAGNAYFTGGWIEYNNYTGTAHVVKLDLDGAVQWQKELPWADGYEGDATSAIYNTATDQLVVVAQMYKSNTSTDRGAAVIKLNASTGAIVGNPTMIRDEVVNDGSGLGNVDPSDIVLAANGDPIVVGHKNGSGTPYALTTASVGESGVIYVDTAVFAGKLPMRYNEWYITGTNITNEVYVTEVNYYENQSATALASTGTGATFTISSDGSGGYVLDSFTGGTGYYIGNKIKVLGTSLGGATPDNDAVVTILAVDAGAITGVNTTPYGVSTGAAQFVDVSGTNIVSGSNATFTARWRVGTDGQVQFPDWTDHNGFTISQQGSGYAVNDKMYLNPNQYGGLTSATITISSVGGSGEIQDFSYTGTFNTSTLKLQVNDSGIDFTTTGSWTAVNYSAEAFIWTPTWAKSLGGSDFDKVNAAATDSQGNIYLACKTYDNTLPAPWGYGYTRGFLAKLDSNGNQVWFKQFSADGYFIDNDGVTGVAVDSNDNIVIVEDNLVTKLDSDGTVIWQRLIGNNDPMGMWNTCVEVDSNDNIYINAEYDSMFNGSTSDDFLVIKFDSTGTVLWQRSVGSTSDEDSNWDNGYQTLSVSADRVFIAGSSYQSNDDVGFAASFPADGSGTQQAHIGSFFYNESYSWTVSTTTSTVSVVSGLSFTSTQFTVTTENNITSVDSTITNLIRTIRSGDVDGRIENLYSLSFEDGSVQTTAYTAGLPRAQDGDFIYNTNNFYPDLSHSGKMIRWIATGWNDQVSIYIPHNDDVAFSIGTQLHFVKDRGIYKFRIIPYSNVSDNGDITIIPSSPADDKYGAMYDSGEGWSVHHVDFQQVPARVTITKIDTNRWLLECSSPTHVMDWNW